MKSIERRNRLSFEAYSLLYAVGMLVALWVCKQYCFYAITGYRVIPFVLWMVLSAALLWRLTIRRERNWVSLVGCAALAAMLYEMLTLWDLPMVRSRMFWTGLGALSGGLGYALIRVACEGGSCAAFWARGMRMAAVLWAVSLLPCMSVIHTEAMDVFGGSDIGTAGNAVTAFGTEPIDTPLTGDALAAELSVLETGWEDCTFGERTLLLDILLQAECRYLGMQTAPALVITELPKIPEIVVGRYDSEKDVIYISSDAVESETGYETASILLHEIRHRYQGALTEALSVVQAREPDLAELRLWTDIKVFSEEFAAYIHPDGSDASYEAYDNQQVELDADNYAAARILHYRALIEDYLSR